VPTVLLILIFYFLMEVAVFKAVAGGNGGTRCQSIGARKQLKRLGLRPWKNSNEYQDALKQERAKLYAEQEAARKKLLDERAALLKDARAKSAEEVAAGKQRIAGELIIARRDVETSIPQLASEIASRILQSPASPSREVR
jgi:Skp family chaperone for outer membrane proteins